MKKCGSCDTHADFGAPECQICGDPFPAVEAVSYQGLARGRSESPPQVLPYSAEQHRPLVWQIKGLKIRTPSGPREIRVPVLAESVDQRSAAYSRRPGAAAGYEGSHQTDDEVGRWL